MPLLLIHMTGRDVMKYEMTEDEVTVGRQRGNTVVLAADTGLSRTHCRIKKRGNGYVVEDAGSANGTRLNGKGIGKDEIDLCNGDRIGIGSTEIVFDDPLSPKRGWLSKMVSTFVGTRKPKRSKTAGGTQTVFGAGFIVCGKCGARIHTGNKSPGQKVGCGRCKSVYVIPSK